MSDAILEAKDIAATLTANEAIVIRGARTHNLKNISCEIPHGKLTVVSGVSGSGKSSLAFDTIYGRWPGSYYASFRRCLCAPGPRGWDPGDTAAGGVDERTGNSVSFFLFQAVQNDSISTVPRSPVA